MVQETEGMNIQELSDATGIPVRTIRFYISEGLLRGPSGRGTSATYTEDHLRRLHLVRQLAGRHLPLNEIRSRLEQVSPEELSQVIEQERELQARDTKAMESSPREYLSALLDDARQHRSSNAQVARSTPPPSDRDTWRRVNIANGIEIHISADAEQKSAELITELIDLARDVAQKERRRKKT